MAGSLQVTLFGVPTLAGGGQRIVFTTERPFQLLAYLACRRQWVRRDELADVLFPGRDGAQARSNLRKVLLLSGRVPGVSAVERQGELLRWFPASDLQRFEEACDERQFADAVELGAAPLLEGLDAAFSGAGAEWLRAERQRAAERWQWACTQRLLELADKPLDAARLARRMLDRDPLDEVAVQALAHAHLGRGESEAASGVLAAYARRLSDELGLEPNAALRALAEEAGRTALAQRPAAPTAHGAAFIGRKAELARIEALLGQPHCRLLTLTGPGGVGKTSTAARVAARLAPGIVESVVVVPLADLTDTGQVPARLAGCLGVTLSGAGEPWTQIAEAIGQRSLALILDNAEQLELGAALERLLGETSRLKLLVTSRARLGAASETVLPLDSLPLPDDDETDVEILRRCDAVALFEARALVAAPGFDLQTHAADVVRLLHLVEGLPVAIELAAVWTHLLPVADIADEIATSIDLLEGGAESGRGVRASFAQSWRLLNDNERACLARLALLSGDFGREMAMEVAGAPLPILGALVDKSLLRSDGSGRFSIHPLLRRCAAEHADPDDGLAMRVARFVARRLGRSADWGVAVDPSLMNDIDRDLAHVRAAWVWAVDQRDAATIGSMARALAAFYEARGMWAEGLVAASHAVAALADCGPGAAHARAHACQSLSILQYRTGAQAAAEGSAREAVALAEPLRDLSLQMAAYNTIGLTLERRGLLEQARGAFDTALQLAQKQDAGGRVAILSTNIALIDQTLGKYAQALEVCERVLASQGSDSDHSNVVATLNLAASSHRVLGRPDLAVQCLNQALVVCAHKGLHAARSVIHINLGINHLEMGQAGMARRWIGNALDESRRHGQAPIEISALLMDALLDAEAQDHASARAKAWEAYALADRLRSASARVECVAAFGEILVHEGLVADGTGLIRWAMVQPTVDRLERDVTERRVAKLLARLGVEKAESRELATDMPIAAVLAIVAARPS